LPPGRAADANDVGYTSSTLFAGVDGSRPKAQASRCSAMHQTPETRMSPARAAHIHRRPFGRAGARSCRSGSRLSVGQIPITRTFRAVVKAPGRICAST